MKRTSSIYFYSDDDGEFWYSLHIDASEPPEDKLAMLSCPIGRYASTFIVLENSQNRPSVFRVENTNSAAFQVVCKRVVQLGPREIRRVEVRYIPTTVGVRETAQVSFRSPENGDWAYNLADTGKPPQPLSPVIVSAAIDSANSALVIFTNPFPYPSRFGVSLTSDHDDVFHFLSKRKTFVLGSFGEEFQIPFSFAPRQLGQFKGFIIIASLGPAKGPLPELDQMPSVRWLYPIIGNSIAKFATEVKIIRCRAQATVEDDIAMTLVGETDVFTVVEYSVSLNLPSDFEFLRLAIEARAKDIQRADGTTSLRVHVRFAPQRPLQVAATLKVTNPLGQEWVFPMDFVAERGRRIETVVIESLLNKEGRAKVVVPTSFRTVTHYQAHFAAGSAVELRLEPDEGTIAASFDEKTELPFDVVFAPKMYGKILKGVLVVDTTDAQYLFDVIGKPPDYFPPVITGTGLIDNRLPENVKRFHEMQTKRRRNVIRENIENVKGAKRAQPQPPEHQGPFQ
jgi:hypothetical protein